MRKRRSALAFLLTGCLVAGMFAPAEAFAQEEGIVTQVQEMESTEQMEEPAEGNEASTEEDAQGENAQKESEKASMEQSAQSETVASVSEDNETRNPESADESGDTAEMMEELSEEEIEVDPEDPGRFRLTGLGTGDVKASEISTQATSSAKYSDCIIQKGIDVSYHNGTIDWKKAKNAGVQFAIIRVAYRGYSNGKLKMDTEALTNMKNANAAGVPIGVYIFSQAITTTEAVQEANYIVSKIGNYKIDLPVVMDFEYVSENPGVGRLYKAKLSKSEATGICKAFCDRVAKLGYTPMVYANKSMCENKIYAADISQKYPIWMAHYTSGKTSYAGEYEYWQYTSSGKVNGVSKSSNKYVDLNYRYLNTLRITGNKPDSISMKWDSYNGSTSYNIYRKSGSGSYKLLKSGVTETSYTDTSLNPGVSYSYKVYVSGGKCIGFNTGITTLGTTNLKARGTAFDKIKLNWSKTTGASSYHVQRYNSSKKAYQTIKTTSGNASVSYTDGSKNASTTYKYRVRPYKIVFNGRSYGSYSEVISAKTKAAVKGKTKSKRINLRKKASKSSKKLGTLKKKGTKVTVIGSSGSWYRLSVKLNGKKRIGYIKKNNIRLY